MNKKIYYFFIFIVILSCIFLASSSLNEKNKISKEVYEKSQTKNVPVIIDINQRIGDQEVEVYLKKEYKEFRKEGNLISVTLSKKELEEIEEIQEIEKITYSHQIKAFLQDSVPLINASTVWPIQLSGYNITGINETICIIDTGINFIHPDLIGKNKTCAIDCYNKACIEDCSVSDDNGHGTHVAGIAAASGGINGVAVGADLIGVKILDSNGNGHPTNGEIDLKNAIDWCVQNRALYNISVISMSLGTDVLFSSQCDSDFSSTLTKAINNATAYNISVIAAAGNNGNLTSIASPACIENATSVGSIRKDGLTIDYNRNSITDFLAPGVNINSTMYPSAPLCSEISCNGNYAIASGTSMATPHIAAAFALIREFFLLQNKRTPSPQEIKTILNSTGKQIYDSGTGLNFSRIDIYSALISIDSSAPSVLLISPENATTQFSTNATFQCSANDVSLSNITLYVWDSSGIYNNTGIIQTSGINAIAEFNLSNMSYGDYEWNCLTYDNKGNYSLSSSNYSLTIGYIQTTLNSPSDNTYTNKNQSFNCTSETEPISQLTNVTLYFWNSSGLIYNPTETFSGLINSTIFNYNFTEEGNYTWNCLSYNNNSKSAWATSNYTIIYDITFPVISSVSAGPSTTSSIINWTTNENSNSSVNYGTGLSLGSISSDNNSETSHSISLSNLASSTTYYYNITGCDLASNCITNGTFSFTTSAPTQPITGSSGGGGSLPGYNTYTPTEEEIKIGYTKILNKNDKIRFTFFDEKTEQHTLNVNYIGKDFVNLTIQSNLLKLILGIRQSAKLNLTSPDYYDLYIKLDSIINNKAEITIQLINEEITKPKISGEVTKEVEETKENPQETSSKIKDILIIMLIIAFLVILILFSKNKIKNMKKDKTIKDYKEKFKSLKGKKPLS